MTDGAQKGLEKPVEKLFAMGGGSGSELWCQIVADVTQRPVAVCQETESTCLGAGMLAAAGTGAHNGIREAAEAMSGEGKTYEPDEHRAAFYDRIYTDVYKEIYPSLAPLFPALADALERK